MLLMCEAKELHIHRNLTYFLLLATIILAIIALDIFVGDDDSSIVCHVIVLIIWWILAVLHIIDRIMILISYIDKWTGETNFSVCDVGFILKFLNISGLAGCLVVGALVYCLYLKNREDGNISDSSD
uniref:Uncharacterized protein n=1 Tax=Cacopsylla melanoneura TaxID=428564 RepID=A0A8D8SLJ2_9HEMI